MEAIILGFALYGAFLFWKNIVQPSLQQHSKNAEYYIEAQAAMMKWADIDLSTAKSFVADYQPVFYQIYQDGILTPELACFATCRALIEGKATSPYTRDIIRDQNIAMQLAHNVIRFAPTSEAAEIFRTALAERQFADKPVIYK